MKKNLLRWFALIIFFSALSLTGCVTRSHEPPISHLDFAKETWLKQINQNPYSWIPKAHSWFFQKPINAMPFNPAMPMMVVRVPDHLTDVKIAGDFQVQLVGQQDHNCIYIVGSKAQMSQIVVEYNSSTIFVHRIAESKMPLGNVIVRIGLKKLNNLSNLGTSRILGRYITSDGLAIFSTGRGSTILTGNIRLRQITHFGFGTVTVIGARGSAVGLDVRGPGHVNLSGKVDVRFITHSGNGCVNVVGACSRELCISTAGAGTTTFVGTANLKELTAMQNSQVYLYWVNSDTVFVNARDQASVGLAGYAQTVNINLQGKAHFLGQYLRAKNVYVRTANSSHANVNPASKLFASATDSSSIYYFDSPKYVSRYAAADSVIIPLGCDSCVPRAKPEPVAWNSPEYYSFEPTFH